ncbi:MAG: helix-turn-helix domain-containing protein [Treponema sp.]|nr:helix-turn-helix domain-containing protein [Treponema sp.]
MKEILKYLRNLNSYSQSDISQKLGISRQTYFKYESGLSLPSEKMIKKLAQVYKVDEAFIIKNHLPSIPEKKSLYSQKESEHSVAEPTLNYSSAEEKGKVYDAYFDGNTVRVLGGLETTFTAGQKFKLVEVAEDRKDIAQKVLMNFRGSLNLPADFDYKKELINALEEKYDSAD